MYKIDSYSCFYCKINNMNTLIPKAAFTTYPFLNSLLNPAYDCKNYYYGSRNEFTTDIRINGEYFRSRSDNQYFKIVSNKDTIQDIRKFSYYVSPHHLLKDVKRINFDSSKHSIVRLEFEKDKAYIVDKNQCIPVSYSEFTVVNSEELLKNIPPFVPLEEF